MGEVQVAAGAAGTATGKKDAEDKNVVNDDQVKTLAKKNGADGDTGTGRNTELRRSSRIRGAKMVNGSGVASSGKGKGKGKGNKRGGKSRKRTRSQLEEEEQVNEDEEGQGQEGAHNETVAVVKRIRKDYVLEDLNADVFGHLAMFLDTDSALALLRTSKSIYGTLTLSKGFWRALCLKQKFHEYTILKTEDEEEQQEAVDDEDAVMKSKIKKMRLSWSGHKFHDVAIPRGASYWQKVYLRGMQVQ